MVLGEHSGRPPRVEADPTPGAWPTVVVVGLVVGVEAAAGVVAAVVVVVTFSQVVMLLSPRRQTPTPAPKSLVLPPKGVQGLWQGVPSAGGAGWGEDVRRVGARLGVCGVSVGGSPQPTAHSPQPTAHSPQPTAHSPQPTARLGS